MSARRLPTGFTLVEVLVVLLLVGLMSTLVALRMDANPNTAAAEEASRLQQMLESAIDRSRATRAAVTWQATETGYSLFAADGSAQKEIDRHTLAQPVRVVGVWHDGVAQTPPFELALAVRDAALFRIRLGGEQVTPLELRSTALGRVELVRGP